MIFLATGVGHSGTKWFSEFMTRNGYPCGHETKFKIRKHGPLDSPDSSWLAVPYLPKGVPEVHLVRDPLKVLNSMIRTNGLNGGRNDPFGEYIYSHRKDIQDAESQLERLIRHVTTWDAPLEKFTGPKLVFKVGDPDDRVADNWNLEALANVIEFCTGDRPDPFSLDPVGRVNDHQRRKPNKFSYENIQDERILRRARKYGFI